MKKLKIIVDIENKVLYYILALSESEVQIGL